jgi:hypothetical protein
MASYLERYRQGECEQVWAELLALGGQIREPRLYAEALSVAHETMTRARANIELLVPRLTSLGYQFAHPDRVFVPADEEFRRLVADVERRAGPLPLSLRAWCDVVGEVNFIGSHPKLSTYLQSPSGEEIGQGFLSLFAKHGGTAATTGPAQSPSGEEIGQGFLSLFAKHGRTAATTSPALWQAAELTQRLLNDVIQRMKTGQPRSPDVEAGVRATKELLEGMQRPAAPAGPDVESDPLVVEPYFGDLEENTEDGEHDEDAGETGPEESGPYNVIIAPDATHKTHQSGGSPYCISFPDPAVDARLQGDEDYGTFVEYLRTCFRWGGFPGLRASAKPPREELAYLTQGLSPL